MDTIFPHDLLLAVDLGAVWEYQESFGRRVYLQGPEFHGRGLDVTRSVDVLAARGMVERAPVRSLDGIQYRLTNAGHQAVSPLIRTGVATSRYGHI